MKKYYYHTKKPLIIYTLNEDSITRSNFHRFKYTSQNLGLAYNEEHTVVMLENNNFPIQVIQKEIDFVMVSLYKNFYLTLQECPEYLLNSWNGAKYFYTTTYFKYQNTSSENFQMYYSKAIKWHHQNRNKWSKNIPLNIYHFLQALKNQENIPAYYLTFTQNHDIINK